MSAGVRVAVRVGVGRLGKVETVVEAEVVCARKGDDELARVLAERADLGESEGEGEGENTVRVGVWGEGACGARRPGRRYPRVYLAT